MKLFNIKVSPSAKSDLKDITEYLSEFDHRIATKYRNIIGDAIASLHTMPLRCPLVRDELLAEKGFRWIFAKNYVVFFTVDEENGIVYIERILYSRMAYDVLL